MHDKTFPGESDAYRQARNALLEDEVKLRRQIEQVAARRRQLPMGGKLKENYVFDRLNAKGQVEQITFDELFVGEKDTLVFYSFMFAPESKYACPSCTSIVDSLDGNIHHLSEQINFVACARAPINQFRAWANQRGWHRMNLISSFGNTFNQDYHAEIDIRRQIPILHVFQRNPEGIFHFHSSELFFLPFDGEQGPRHVDSIWPLWNVLDLTPGGRGEWNPKNSYD